MSSLSANSEISLFVVQGAALDPAFVRECAGRLSPEARAEFARMADPRAADVRAVLRDRATFFREQGFAVSVSHSGDFGVLAVSNAGASPGVDAEPWAGSVPDDDLVRGVTSAEEFSAWLSLAAPARRAAFVRLWTLKESALKARDVGLAGGMRTVRLRPDFYAIDEPGISSALIEADSEYAVSLVWAGGPATVDVVPIAQAASF